MAFLVISCQFMPNIILLHFMAFHIISYHFMPNKDILWHFMSFHVIFMSFHVILCQIKTFHAVLYKINEEAQKRHPQKCKHKNPTNSSRHKAVKKRHLQKCQHRNPRNSYLHQIAGPNSKE